jgi:MFS family permease
MTTAAVPANRREIEVIAIVGYAHGTSHFFQLVIPPLFPWLMPEFGMNFTQAGMIMALFFTVSGVGQALAGFLVDRFGARFMLITANFLFAVSALLLASAQNYSMLLLVAALSALGNSVFHPADFTLLNRNLTRARLGHGFSVHALSGSLGWATAPAFMAGIAVATDWRTAAVAASAMAVGPAILLWLRRDAMTEAPLATAPAVQENASSSLFAFLSSTAVWVGFLFYFLVMISFGAIQNFSAAALQFLYNLSVSASASLLTLYMLGSAAGVVLGGFLVTRSDAHDKRIAAVLITAALLAVIIASGSVPAWSIAVFMAGAGFCNGVAVPSRDMLVRQAAINFGPHTFGRVYGFVYSGLDIGLAISPFIFGALLDAGYIAWVLGGAAIAQTLAVFAALNVGRYVPTPEPATR